MKRLIFGVLLLPLIFNYSCAPSRFVEPLEKKELSVGGNFGGPVILFVAPIPLPLTAIEVGYGVDTNFTVFGGLHTTSLLFGNLQLDGGFTYQFLEQNRFLPNLSATPSFQFTYNFQDGNAKFWPVLDLNAFWNYGQRRNYFYLGVNNYFELSSTMAHEQPQTRQWLFSPQLGHVTKGKKEQWQFTTELKILGPTIDNTDAFIPYASLTGSRGAVGFFIGSRWIIGKKKR